MKNKCEVIFLGHAGFLIEADIRLLCDPWATKNGAMLGAWHQLPDNCDYIESNKSVLTAEFVWLSHEHTDHFDIEFLSKLPQETVFILPKFLTNNMPRALSQHGFRNIVLLDNGDRFELSPDITVNMILEEPVWSEHSSLVIRSRETVLLHNSDSYLTKAQLTKIKAAYKPNIYIGQYSATSPFPDVMKEWNESQKSGFRNKHLAWAMNRFVESVKYCGAETAIPCAGPAVVVEPRRLEVSRQKANLVGGCMNLKELFGQLSSRLPRVKIKYLSIGQTIAEGCETPPSPSEVLEAIDRVINERYCLNLSINPSATVEDIRDLHEALFARACKFAPHIISRIGTCLSIYFSDLNKRIDTKFISNTDKGLPKISVKVCQGVGPPEKSASEYYQIQLSSDIWCRYVNNEFVFDELFYSQRQEIVESEHGYFSDLITLLRTLHSEKLLEAANQTVLEHNTENVTVYHEGEKHVISKFCPHMGVSLEGVPVCNDGTLECPAHKWRFSILTGQSLGNDRTKTIKPHLLKSL